MGTSLNGLNGRNAKALLAAAAVALSTGGGGAVQAVQAGQESSAKAACARLSALTLPDVAITSAAAAPAAGPVPSHCDVSGVLEGTIHFRVALPAEQWNGKYFVAGGGGFNGTIPNLNQALARGYAVAGSDTGHQGQSSDASWALDNEKAQLDYAHRATHLVTVLGKTIAHAYYGREARRSYFVGCSNGGKMGLMEVLRYPDDFDGVVIGNFVTDRTRLMMAYTWNAQALASAPIPPAKIAVLAKATLAACDAKDGLEDGVVDRPDRCRFDLGTITCAGPDGPGCLTAGQAAAVRKIWSGPSRPDGTAIFPGFVPGHEEDYPAYITGEGVRHAYPASTWRLQDGFMRFFAFGADYDPVASFDFATSPAALAPLAADQDAGPPAMEAFKAHGGKLIMYHGWADHSIPPTSTLEFYGQLQARFAAETEAFTRLYMAPGLHHCTSGPGPNVFGGANQGYVPIADADHDVVMALDRWVETGEGPEAIVATKYVDDDPSRGVARTRPLCPYPAMARYTGRGRVDDAANFRCAMPQ
ncbi:MAG: tannase/feruloyl esterase family alpha/beta hydrolase [Vicinamibacterales bacterium]